MENTTDPAAVERLAELKTTAAKAAAALTRAHAHLEALDAARTALLERRATAARLVTQSATDREIAIRSRENGSITPEECDQQIADAATTHRAAGVELETTAGELREIEQALEAARAAIPQAEATRNQAEVAVFAEIEKLEIAKATADLSTGLSRLHAALTLTGSAGAFAAIVNKITSRAHVTTAEVAGAYAYGA